jgi:hypothetical protein
MVTLSCVVNGRRIFQSEQRDGLLAHLEFADLAGDGPAAASL